MSRYKNIVFDVGSVLVNWMRMNLYTTLFHGDREKAARDAFLFIGLVGFPHSDGSDRAHFHTGMAGCTFSLTSFWMQRNRLGITIRAISIYHQSADC